VLHLSHYILLINWTQQGINRIKDTAPDRYSSFKTSVEKEGGKLTGAYYTMGEYDMVLVIEAPSDETVMSLMLKVGSLGNARTPDLESIYC
jgi:uncharacterized protein with GYD domain